jgi:hypothetical protein
MTIESVEIFAVGSPPALPAPQPYEPHARKFARRDETTPPEAD